MQMAGEPELGSLFGREEELAELHSALDDARAGRGGLVLVAGEAGIGKTRLVEALVESTTQTDTRAWSGRCWEGGGGRPYWPWRQLVRSCIAESSSDALVRRLGVGAADVAQLVPELGDRIPGWEPARPSGWPDSRLRLFDAVTTLLRNAGAEGAAILALDDLHAADEASLRLLEHLVDQRLAESNLLVIGTYRDVEVRSSPPLHRRMVALARRGRRLVLGGLDGAAVELLLRATTGSEAPGTVSQRVHDLSDGNPLFVQELGRLLVTEHGVRSADDIELPEELYSAIRRRLEVVDHHTRRLLTLAAVLGKDFVLGTLSVLANAPPTEVLDILDRASELGVAREGSLGRWRFTHGLLREVVYGELRPSERLELHRRAGDALERGGGASSDEHLPALAHHFFHAARGGDGVQAVRYCTLAGHAALAVLAFEEAAMQYSRALEALALAKPVDERQRYDLLTALGAAEQRSGRFPQAREAYRRALKAARVIGSPELFAQAAIGYVGPPESAVDETSKSVLEEADAALPEGDSPLRARLILAGASTIDYEEGRRRSARALEVARQVDDPLTLREVLLQWHLLNQGFDLNEQRLAAADDLFRLATEAGDRERRAVARQWRAYDLFEVGDVVRARGEFELARSESEELRVPFLVWGATFPLAAIALLEGRLADAQRLTREALLAGERSEFADVEGVRQWQLFGMHRYQGLLGEMLDVGRRAAEQRTHPWPGVDRVKLIVALAESGRLEEARAEVAAVADRLLEGYPGWLTWMADACWLIAEPRWAARIYERLAPAAGLHAMVGVAALSCGAFDRYLGQMSTMLERYEEAEAHFERAHSLHERMGAPAWLAQGQADHARMLLQRHEAGDHERALQLLHEAETRYRELGLERHAARIARMSEPARAPVVTLGEADSASFLLEGEYWELDYRGGRARFRDSKGLQYLARLLASPGQELHALDLVVGQSAQRPLAERARADALVAVGGDAGAVLDTEAKAAYRRRLHDLEDEIEEAQSHHDLARAERAEREKDFLIAELASALGLAGRDRKAASNAERARQSVQRAIRGAIERIADAHPLVGEHLRSTVRTGTYCSYAPDPRAPIVWRT